MKRILYLILLISSAMYGQSVTDSLFVKSLRAKKGNKVIEVKDKLKLNDTLFFKDGSYQVKAGGNIDTTKVTTPYFVGKSIHDSLQNVNLSFNGNRLVTRSGVAQVNAGGETITSFLNNYFFPSTSPTASISLSVSTSQEYMASGSAVPVSLNWTVNRPVACTAISTIVVNAVSQTVNAINEGQSQSGTLAGQSMVRNTNQSFSVNVTSQDGKSGSASTSVTWYWKRYWGTIASNASPSDAQILALNNELSTTRVKSYDGISGGGQYLIFAFPSAWGVPVFKVYGLTNSAFTKMRDNAFTNASGGSTTYQVWISNTVYNGVVSDFNIE